MYPFPYVLRFTQLPKYNHLQQHKSRSQCHLYNISCTLTTFLEKLQLHRITTIQKIRFDFLSRFLFGFFIFHKAFSDVPIPAKKKKLTQIFIFTVLCSASKNFMKALKAFIKPFEAPQRSLKIKL